MLCQGPAPKPDPLNHSLMTEHASLHAGLSALALWLGSWIPYLSAKQTLSEQQSPGAGR